MRRSIDPAAVGLAVLVFLCSSDLVFSARMGGVNVRFGQVALVAIVIALVPRPWRMPKPSRDVTVVVVAWLVFFAAYSVAALFAPETGRTLLKLGWGAFNIGLAAAFCFSRIPMVKLASVFAMAAAVLAAIVWTDAVAIHWLDQGPLVGLAQRSLTFEDHVMLRPHAFHYEPSYIGATLGLAVPLVLAAQMTPTLSIALTALIASGLILTSSRTGTLGLVLGAMLFAVLAWKWRLGPLQRLPLRAAAIATALIVAFGLHPGGARYLRFIAGPLGPGGLVERMEGETSEGMRLKNVKWAIAAIGDRPILGRGVSAGSDRTIGTQTFNTWLEVGVEAGLLGLLTFAAAVFATLRWASVHRGPALAVASTAWFIHLAVNLNFTQSFPRLDYWLWFFLSVRLAHSGSGHVEERSTTQNAPAP